MNVDHLRLTKTMIDTLFDLKREGKSNNVVGLIGLQRNGLIDEDEELTLLGHSAIERVERERRIRGR